MAEHVSQARRLVHALLRCAALLAVVGAAAPASAGVSGGIELLETHLGPGADFLQVESAFVVGAGLSAFALKVDGAGDTRPAFEDVQVQVQWKPQVTSNIALAVGLRHDLRAGPNQSYVGAGIEANLLPWLAGEHYVFLSRNGDVTGAAKLVARFQLRQSLVLEPRVEFGWAAQAIPTEDLAAGFSDARLSVRLRHSLSSKIDLYAGVIHETLLGQTADIARGAGDPVHATRAVIGTSISL